MNRIFGYGGVLLVSGILFAIAFREGGIYTGERLAIIGLAGLTTLFAYIIDFLYLSARALIRATRH